MKHDRPQHERSFTEGAGGGEVVVAVVDGKRGRCKTAIKEWEYGSGVVQRVIEKIEELLNES